MTGAGVRQSERGMVLILAMLGLAMLTVFAMSLGFGVRQKAALLNRLSTLDALYPIAYSGVENAKSLVHADFDVKIDTLLDLWAGAAPKQVEVMNGYFLLDTGKRPGLSDEDGKINLNKLKPTDVAILARLLEGTGGLGHEQALELAYGVLDWADSDPFFSHPEYGAEDPYYGNLKLPYEAKDKPYEVIDELLLVKGMTRQVFDRIRPFVTVYGAGPVNINTAPAEVLSALGFNTTAVDTIVRWRAGMDEQEGTGDDNFFTSNTMIATDLQDKARTPLDGEQVGVLDKLILSPGIGVTSFFFGVHCHAVLERSGASMDAEAVIDRQGNTHYFRIVSMSLHAETLPTGAVN